MRTRRLPGTPLAGAAATILAILLSAGPNAWPGEEPVAGTVPTVAPARPHVVQEPGPGRGFVPPTFDLPAIEAPVPASPRPLVSHFDWRESGKVTPVKNQGTCGSCYAFASTGNVESKILIDGGDLYNLSENNVKECEYFGSSCSGGNYWRVTNFLATNGTVLETCDPYVAANVACKNTCEYVHTLLDWREFSHDTVAPTATIKAYLQTFGPIYTSMYAGSGDAWNTEFNGYNGSYTLYYAGSETPNHAVLIIGWDDDLTHAGGQGAWIVKNSWGTSWGGTCGYGTERGYFTIAYGSARIGTWASFIYDWQDYEEGGSLYHYDEAGYVSSLGYGLTTAWGLCKYVPGNDVLLRRVELWTADVTTDIDVYVYDDFNGTSLSGLLASKLNSSFDLPGYHSIELTTAPRVTSGDDIYVVAKITDATYKYPLVFDSISPRSVATSYISSNGSMWSELTVGDLGIRLRASPDPSCGAVFDVPVLAGVEDVPGDNGGHVRLTWHRSSYDGEGSSPEIRRYKIWRKIRPEETLLLGNAPLSGVPASAAKGEHGEDGPAWELVGMVPATGTCTYVFDAATPCDGEDCLTQFYVSAHTGAVGQHFDSPVESGYSVDNLVAEGEGGESEPPGPAGQVKVTALMPPQPASGVDGFIIRFDLGRADWVRLDVYDIGGRRVAAILDGSLEAGSHTAPWDGRGGGGTRVAPGIYFVRLLTSEQACTAKLVKMR
jgi:C1A family cysteine protease